MAIQVDSRMVATMPGAIGMSRTRVLLYLKAIPSLRIGPFLVGPIRGKHWGRADPRKERCEKANKTQSIHQNPSRKAPSSLLQLLDLSEYPLVCLVVLLLLIELRGLVEVLKGATLITECSAGNAPVIV